MVVKCSVGVLKFIYFNKPERWNIVVSPAFDREQIGFSTRPPGPQCAAVMLKRCWGADIRQRYPPRIPASARLPVT